MDDSIKKPFTQKLTAFLIILNLVTMAALWYVLFRRPPGGPPPRDAGQGGDVQTFLRRELNLADEQDASFLKARDKFIESAAPIHEEIRKLNETAIAEMLKPQADAAAIETTTARIGALRGHEQKLLFLHFQDLMAACTPDQKIKFLSIMREFMVRIGFLDQPGGPRGGPRPQNGRGGPPPQDMRGGPPPQNQPGGPPPQNPRGGPPGRRNEQPLGQRGEPPPPPKK